MLQAQDQASEDRDHCQDWELEAQRGEMRPLLCGGVCRSIGTCDRHSSAWQTTEATDWLHWKR